MLSNKNPVPAYATAFRAIVESAARGADLLHRMDLERVFVRTIEDDPVAVGLYHELKSQCVVTRDYVEAARAAAKTYHIRRGAPAAHV